MMSTAKPRQKPDYYLEMMDGELLLFHPGRTTILYCNRTAALIWQLCNGRRTVQEIAALLATAYPEATETIPGQVQATLQKFQQQGVVECETGNNHVWPPG